MKCSVGRYNSKPESRLHQISLSLYYKKSNVGWCAGQEIKTHARGCWEQVFIFSEREGERKKGHFITLSTFCYSHSNYEHHFSKCRQARGAASDLFSPETLGIFFSSFFRCFSFSRDVNNLSLPIALLVSHEICCTLGFSSDVGRGR